MHLKDSISFVIYASSDRLVTLSAGTGCPLNSLPTLYFKWIYFQITTYKLMTVCN